MQSNSDTPNPAHEVPSVDSPPKMMTLRLARPAVIELLRTLMWSRVTTPLLDNVVSQVLASDPTLTGLVVDQYINGNLRDFEIIACYRELITIGVDDPSASDLAEHLLDRSLPSWREWPARPEMIGALTKRLVPSHHQLDVARCTATTRKGTRCQNTATCRLHADMDR